MSTDIDLKVPAHVERVPASVSGHPSARLILVLRAIGCTHARRTGGGCSMCGFLRLTSQGAKVSAAELIAQFDSVVDAPGALDGIEEVDLYNSGSFLADEEVPPEARAHILGRLGQSAVRRVLIESRPEYVQPEVLAEMRTLLGSRELEVAIGLESSDDHVREDIVGKGFDREEFERAVSVLGGVKARLLAYVLIGPLGLDEKQAVEDAVASAGYVFVTAARARVAARVALEPVFVVPGTPLEREFLSGRYQPPNLWAVVEVVRRAHRFGEVLIGLSTEGLAPLAVPTGCSRCTGPLRTALAEYNRTRDLSVFVSLRCDCRTAST
jgi:archaeosine synthase beta-subunit